MAAPAISSARLACLLVISADVKIDMEFLRIWIHRFTQAVFGGGAGGRKVSNGVLALS
jgi:hypothetical protein